VQVAQVQARITRVGIAVYEEIMSKLSLNNSIS
jgi:hypothetical protein